MRSTLQIKLVASGLGAMVAVSPLVLFCLVGIFGGFSADPLDDAPKKGAAIFLTFGVPIIFGCFLCVTSAAVMLFHQKIATSIPALVLASFLIPPIIAAATTYFYAHDPISVFRNKKMELLAESTVTSLCLCAGLFSTRWYLRREPNPNQ